MKKYLKLTGLFLLLIAISLTITGCQKKPEDVVKKMITKMASVDSLSYKADLNLRGAIPSLDTGLTETALNTENVSSDLVLNAEGQLYLKNDNYTHKIILDAGLNSEDTDLDLGLELVLTADTTYAKVNTAPNMGMIDFSTINDSWYTIDLEGLADPLAVETGDEEEFSRSEMKKLKKLISKTNFFKVKEDLGKEDLEGNSVYHYRVDIDTASVKTFLTEFNNLLGYAELTEDEQKEMQDSLQLMESLELEMWIGAKKYYLHKLAVVGYINDPDASVESIDLTINFNDFNSVDEIALPAEAKEFNLAEVLMMPSLPTLPTGFNPEDLEKMDLPELTPTQLEELTKMMEEYEQ